MLMVLGYRLSLGGIVGRIPSVCIPTGGGGGSLEKISKAARFYRLRTCAGDVKVGCRLTRAAALLDVE